MNNASDLCFVGIDVSKAVLELGTDALRSTERFDNTPAGHKSLIARVAPLRPAKIVLEATGGYENPILHALERAGLPAVRVNPRPVRNFAKGLNILAKTDGIDAHVLAVYGKLAQPPRRELPQAATVELRALTSRRRQLVEMQTAENNRLETVTCKKVIAGIKRMLRTIAAQIQTTVKHMSEIIAEHQPIRRIVEILDSAPGIGPVTAAVLAAELPEIGSLSRQAIAALVGVAPYNNDSGAHKGKRTIRGGRTDVRNALYMAALVATQHNPVIREDYQRLISRGKLPKVALVAAMRKLLTILNAMVREDTLWQPSTPKIPL